MDDATATSDEVDSGRTGRGGESAAGGGSGPTTWVVSKNGSECDHPEDGLRRVGDDGRNTYLQCGDCDAVVVVPDGLVGAALAARPAPERPE